MNDLPLRAFAALVLVVPSTGCLSTPTAPRHEFVEPIAPPLNAMASDSAPLGVHLVGVSAAETARDVLSWRDGDGSVWRDEGTRFSSAPADFVRRSFQRRLAGGSASRARLEVELLHFGARTTESGTAAEVVVFALLEDEEGALSLAREYHETLAVPSPIAPGRGSAAMLAVALGAATETIVERVLADVARELAN
jgi:hypothetical protein